MRQAPAALTSEKPGAPCGCSGLPVPLAGQAAAPCGLPEEVVDHVEDFAGIDVDQQDVVIIADPLRARIGAGGRRYCQGSPIQ